ncbi:unnamed protein product [Ascophyllum nodosum]
MAMFISQETFDDVVKENMEDFGMEKQAALEDALQQFQSQGADLSMVDTSADGIRRDSRATLLRCLDALRECDDVQPEGQARSHCLEAFSKTEEMCREEGTAGAASRTAFDEAGGVGVVARFLGAGEAGSFDESVVAAALSTLSEACRNHERNRDHFLATNMAQLNSMLSEWTEASRDGERQQQRKTTGFVEDSVGGGAEPERAALAAAGLRLVRTVATKNERNKGTDSNFMRHNGKAILVSALEIYGSGNEKDAAALREACGALRSVTLGDDMRQDFSGTYDNVKALVSAGAVRLLLDVARAFASDSSTIPWVFLALKQLAANTESVKLTADQGGLDVISEAIVGFPLDVAVCRSSLSLFRNIAADDVLKTRLVNEDGLRLILGCMSQHRNDKLLQEHGCATMAAMSLRSPANGARIVSEGGIAAIVEAMRRHPAAVGLQRQACLCIRNIAARGPSLRSAMLDEGCETALREAGKLRGCVDEAYGALRDLRCEVDLMTMSETGELQVGVKAFGQEKPNFDPSLQQTSCLAGRISSAAAAPFRDAGTR